MSTEYEYNEWTHQDQTEPEAAGTAPEPAPAGSAPADNGAYRFSGSQIPGQSQEPAGQPDRDRASADRDVPPSYSRPANTGYTAPQNGYDPSRNSYGNYARPGYGQSNPGYGAYVRGGSGYQQQGTYQQPGGYGSGSYGYSAAPEVKQKKSGGGKKILVAAVICALLGGIGGGTAIGMAIRNMGSTAAAEASVTESVEPSAAEAETPKTETSQKPDNINATVIDVTTNSETTSMTPQDVYEHYVNAVVAISNEGTTTNMFGQVSATASSGSGFIISEDGYIITNNHVVEGAQKLTVLMTSGEEYEATIIGADEENDVALIKIDATGLPTVSIGDSDTIEVGEQVCAIGNPLGELTNTLTVGYVSALDREINENRTTPINMFQTDCAINAGNSGGPIFDMHGNVIGITTAKYSSSGTSYSASIEGIGFCIPINDAMDIVSDLLEYGYVKGRPALGISCQAISSTVTQYYNLPTGVYVYSVSSGGAADKAGIREGDIITAIDGVEVSSITAFKSKLKEYSAGDTAVISVYRSDTAEKLEFNITFDERSSTTGAQSVQG